MGNRNAFQVHVLAYLIANSKLYVWGFSYARISGMTNRKDAHVHTTHLHSFVHSNHISRAPTWDTTYSFTGKTDIQMNHAKEYMVIKR